MQASVRVACVQAEPVILDRDATLDKLARFTAEAAAERRAARRLPGDVHPGVPVVALGEGVRRLGRPAREGGVRAARARVARGAGRRRAAGSGEIAREHGVWLVTGVNEVDPERPGTIYNSLLYHSPDGRLALHHRKLVPTNHERLVWGQGDGRGLDAVETGSAGSAG